MKTKRIRLKDITADQLNANCLRLMAKCALKLRTEHEIILQLNHRKSLPRLRRKIKKTQDQELIKLYEELKTHLNQSLRETAKSKPLN